MSRRGLCALVEASEDVSGDSPASKRPCLKKEKVGTYGGSLPYFAPCFRLASDPPLAGKTEKYATPIVSIKVGPELETFKVHQGMLTFAAEYFDKMFKGNFKEALEDSAEFPDDDPNAWTFLIDWCYEGKLPSISPPPLDAKFDEEETAACWTRLKLCCRAEKAGCERGPKLKLAVLKKWCLYVYENTPESSKLRRFMSRFFHYGLKFCSSSKDQFCLPSKEIGTQPKITEYGGDEMYKLALEIPDLTRDLFLDIQRTTNTPNLRGDSLEPWSGTPCEFHAHSKRGWPLQCLMSLGRELRVYTDQHPSSVCAPRVQYFLQDMTLRGSPICYVQQVAGELLIDECTVKGAVKRMTWVNTAQWVVPEQSFRLAPPR